MKIGFFDLETKRLFDEVGGKYPITNAEKLGLAVAGVIINDEAVEFFTENEVKDLIRVLNSADLIVGHNVIEFDYYVLNPYFDFSISSKFKDKTIDTMLHIEKIVRKRLGLGDLARHTLGVGKSGDPKEMPFLWRSGKHDKVKSYLKNDVEILRNLYLHGKTQGWVKCDINGEVKEIPVTW